MTGRTHIRPAVLDDLPALVGVYNHYVINSHVTFDTHPFTVEQRASWFDQFADAGPHRLLVADADGACAGYASSHAFRAKPAYDTSVETTAYVAPDWLGQGIGRLLYRTLLDELEAEPLHRAYGGIAQPNAASVALHESLGYTLVGTYREVGFKFDRYWDVSWYEKTLGGAP